MRRHPFLTGALAMLTLIAFSSPAMARDKRVTIEIKNDAYREALHCKLYRQVNARGGKKKWKYMKRYTIEGREDRPSSQGNGAQTFRASIPPRVKTLSGKYRYPKIKLTCEMPKNNHAGKKDSEVWDPAKKSFDSHKFEVYGRYGNPTSVIVEDR